MSTDREVLEELLDAIESDRAYRAGPLVRRATERACAHVFATAGRDCSAEVERASRAAYAAGQARNAGAAP